jgi:hypothetical protein
MKGRVNRMRDNTKIEQSIKRIHALSELLNESVLENLQHSEYAYLRNNASKSAIESQIKILRYELLNLKKEL